MTFILNYFDRKISTRVVYSYIKKSKWNSAITGIAAQSDWLSIRNLIILYYCFTVIIHLFMIMIKIIVVIMLSSAGIDIGV